MRWKSKFRDVRFTPYVVQIGGNAEVLYVNYAININKAFADFIRKHPHLRQSKLRTDLFDSGLYFRTSKRADRGTRQLIANLETQDYEVIAGGPLHNPYWRVYAIEIDGDPKHLYIGETNYPVEKRYQQHIYGFNSARIFLRYDCFELAMHLVNNLPFYTSKQASLEAEAETARVFRTKGYKVEGGH